MVETLQAVQELHEWLTSIGCGEWKVALMKKEILSFTGPEEKPVILDPLFEYWLRNTYFK